MAMPFQVVRANGIIEDLGLIAFDHEQKWRVWCWWLARKIKLFRGLERYCRHERYWNKKRAKLGGYVTAVQQDGSKHVGVIDATWSRNCIDILFPDTGAISRGIMYDAGLVVETATNEESPGKLIVERGVNTWHWCV